MVSGIEFITLQSFAIAFKTHYQYLSYLPTHHQITRNTHASKLQGIIFKHIFSNDQNTSPVPRNLHFIASQKACFNTIALDLAVGSLVSSLGFLVA